MEGNVELLKFAPEPTPRELQHHLQLGKKEWQMDPEACMPIGHNWAGKGGNWATLTYAHTPDGFLKRDPMSKAGTHLKEVIY